MNQCNKDFNFLEKKGAKISFHRHFNKLFSFFLSWCFLKEIENMYSVFLSSSTNTRESLGELEKAVASVLVLPNFHSCFYNSIETGYMFFYF